jgi:hypothetical protein
VYVGLGTSEKYYVSEGSVPQDITPLRATTAAGDVTFAATNGSAILTVSDNAHGAVLGDYVTYSGAVSLGGVVTAAVLNKEYEITDIVNSNSYKITLAVTANASDVGNGGAAVIGRYQINVGLDGAVSGTGWGAGPWSRGTWNSSYATSGSAEGLRLWSHDNFGEDLVMCVRNGGVYYWDASTGAGTRAVPLSALAGAQATPTVARIAIVSEVDRHVLAFGCDPEATPGVQDPLTIRFSDQESAAEWRTLTTTTAGELRIGTGSGIIAAVQTKQQIIVFTDISVHAMQYIGEPFTFGIQEVSTSITIASQNAAVTVGDMVFWMGVGQFYMYNGAVQQLPCTVKEYVFSDININQLQKVYGGNNTAFAEVWWFYPSANATQNDLYVVYNYIESIWYYGSLSRAAWLDSDLRNYPLAATFSNNLVYHENGVDSNESGTAVAITATITSGEFSLDEGDKFMMINRILPDMTFVGSTAGSPSATMTLLPLENSGSGYNNPLSAGGNSSSSIVRSASVPIEEFTGQAFVRIRGRQIAVKIESTGLGVTWKLGIPRIDLRPDGRRG